jgi:hypothetical protein
MATYSKNGWPLGKADHDFGQAEDRIVDRLINHLTVQFSEVSGVFKAIPITDGGIGGYSRVKLCDSRISVEKYGQIRSYIVGYKHALYG